MADETEEFVTMTVKLPAGKKKVAKILAIMLDTTLGRLGGGAVEARLDQEAPEFTQTVTGLIAGARERAGITAPAPAIEEPKAS